jgi:Zn-dependent protease
MLRSFYLGRALSIPLYIHSTFLLIPLWAAFVSRSEGLVGILFHEVLLLAVFGCVILHELGHAWMARRFGIGTRDITLYPIGGVARLETISFQPMEELCIALAGPAVNLAIVLLLAPMAWLHLASGRAGELAASLLSVSGPGELLAHFLFWLWGGNLVLLLLNLLPAFPMDGGRVLRALLALRLGRLRATEIAATLGLIVAGLLGAYGLYEGVPTILLIALFVSFAGQMELRALRYTERLEPEYVRVAELAPTPREPMGFTGLAWDQDARVWVRWHNGRPIEVYG